MAENMKIPFGYCVVDGEITYTSEMVLEVLKAFRMYVDGHSYQSIADDFTSRKVEYLQGQYVWNKNRVKRMLENKRYLGGKFPQLISEEQFLQVQDIITSRANNREPRETTPLRSHIICGDCGDGPKKSSVRNVTWWRCSCGTKINEAQLLKNIDGILCRCENADSLQLEAPTTTSDELEYLQNKIKVETQKEDLDEAVVKGLIKAYCVAEYNNLQQYEDENVSMIKEKLATISEPVERIVAISKCVKIYKNGDVTAMLLTDKEI